MQSTETEERKNLKRSRSFPREMPVTDTTVSKNLDDCILFPVEEIVQYPLPGYGAPNSISFSPDDSLITYLFSPDYSLNRKVFTFDLKTCKQELFFSPPDGGLDESNISAEEKLRRERLRERGLGVTRYEWVKMNSKKKTIMVPLPAGIYFQDLSLQPELKLISASCSPIVDPHLSPDGTMLAYVKNYELHVLNLLYNESKQLTFGADGNVLVHGLAEYIAQEEMDRKNGYWWSLDSKFIAFTEVDSSEIPLFRIMHQGKSTVGPEAQEDHAYPFAGASNVKVRLGVICATGGPVTWMELHCGEKDKANNDEEYLARVNWMHGNILIAQVLNRSHSKLTILRFDIKTGQRKVIMVEEQDQQHKIKNHEPPQPINPTSITEPKTTPTPQFTSRTQTLRRLSFSKPKARNVEFNLPPPTRKTTTSTTIPQYSDELEPLNPTNYSTDDSDDDEEEEFEESEDEMGREKLRKKKKKKVHWKAMVEWALFIIILTCLVCSLTIESVKTHMTWGVEVWRWCLMVMVIFSGRLVSGWVMGFVVFLIERNFMLREKVLYFVYGLRKSFQNCVWLGLVLLSWTFMFNPNVHHKDKMLGKVFKALVAVLIGATIWLIKIVLVKVLASSFHVATYFDRMKESVFHHYILNTLSGPPMDEAAYEAAHNHNNHHLAESKTLPAKLRKGARSLSKSMKRFGSRRVDIEKLRKMSLQSTKSAWSVKRLVNYVRFFGLSTISNTVDGFGSTESEIGSEWEARNCAKRIFKNVAKQGAKYIEEEDLMRFLTRVEIHTIFPLFEGALETGKITKSAFRNWVVRAYLERKALAHSLNDTKTAVHQLHKLASAIVSVIIIVVSLLVTGLATTKVLLFVVTQLVLVGFMFQNSCKTVFESIIFVFVMHPFDIGDRCVIDGVQMVVEEMNILTTVFLRYDMEKIYYPNSVLLTKPISNFYRSPEMIDLIDFTIDVYTSIDSINALKTAIQTYLENKPKHWNPKHLVMVKEIQDMNRMKMCLCVQHTMNHQNYFERNCRVTELILELKKILENLGIKYRLLPQEIHLTQVDAANRRAPLQS